MFVSEDNSSPLLWGLDKNGNIKNNDSLILGGTVVADGGTQLNLLDVDEAVKVGHKYENSNVSGLVTRKSVEFNFTIHHIK